MTLVGMPRPTPWPFCCVSRAETGTGGCPIQRGQFMLSTGEARTAITAHAAPTMISIAVTATAVVAAMVKLWRVVNLARDTCTRCSGLLAPS